MAGPVLVTGAAGFIGAAVVDALLERGDEVVGVDDLNPYYDPALKQARLARLDESSSATGTSWRFHRLSIEDRLAMHDLFSSVHPRAVVHLAAQAGVRHSLLQPALYTQSNLVGFGHILEGCRQQEVAHLVYASSSSVYGGNQRVPFCETHAVDHPLSLYAATKRANELMAHSYSHLYGLPSTGLRFFTVYGPWGRPDMAPMLFARAILLGEPIRVFNQGKMKRDFTFINDVVEGVLRCLDKPATPDAAFDPFLANPSIAAAPHRLFNLGHSQPVELLRFITSLEQLLGRQAIRDWQPMQPGDVVATWANTDALEAWVGFRPRTSLEKGLASFARWVDQFPHFLSGPA